MNALPGKINSNVLFKKDALESLLCLKIHSMGLLIIMNNKVIAIGLILLIKRLKLQLGWSFDCSEVSFSP